MSIDKKRWISVLFLIVIGTATAFIYQLSVFMNPLSTEHGWAIPIIVLAFTFAMWSQSPASILAGYLNDKIGPKKTIIIAGICFGASVVASGFVTNVYAFIILQGIVASFCVYIAYVPTLALLGKLFPDYRGMAIGIFTGGCCIGNALLAPIAQAFISNMSVQYAIGLEGLLYGGLTVICALLLTIPPEGYTPKNYVPPTEEETLKKGYGIDVEPKNLFKMPLYYMVLFMFMFIGTVSLSIVSSGSVIAETTMGLSPEKAAWVMSIINVGGGVGGFIFGVVADKWGGHTSCYVIALLETIGGFAMLITGFNSVIAFFMIMTILGFAYGGVGVVIPVVVMNTFGEKHFGMNFGLVNLQVLISAYVGPQLAVRLEPSQFFMVIGILGVIAIILVTVVKRMTRQLNQNNLGLDTADN